ncbi:hypothetical protein HDU79_005969 [Rhizoclosmatium sp. JEL0117]|nr:hypothetical protein HDU79_005969 [Rhizoclosmatium sp. JEL0117]
MPTTPPMPVQAQRVNPFSSSAALESTLGPSASGSGSGSGIHGTHSLEALVQRTKDCSTSTKAEALKVGSRLLVAPKQQNKTKALSLNDAAAKSHALWAKTTPLLQRPAALPSHSALDVSAAAWEHVRKSAEDQAIVLLGESNSGKTETRRLLTRHLCEISTLKPSPSTPMTKRKKSKLVSAILKLDTILAAFTRAATPTNSNASCSGTYYEFQFSHKKSKICGVKVIDLGLDKSRVSGASVDAGCNFHVFYLLLEGASADEKTQWQLGELSVSAHYHYLNTSSIRRVSSDDLTLETLREALKSVGIGPRHQTQLFQLLSAILHLGNIAFVDSDGEKKDEPASIKNTHQLSLVADLLGVHPSTLESTLTYKTQLIRKDKISVFLDAKAAAEQRDALARALYSIVYSYLIEQINNALCETEESQWANFIALVDLPGTVLSPHVLLPGGEPAGHGFSRLLVNYANAKLEQFMMDQVITLPRDVLRAEGFREEAILPVDRKLFVEAFDGDLGLLPHIDLECAVGTKGSKLMERLREAEAKAGSAPYQKYIDLLPNGDKKTKHAFTVTHYAEGSKEVATLQYDAKLFVEANSDVLQSDFVSLIRGTTEQPGTSSAFLRGLFSDRMVATLTHAGDAGTVVAAMEKSRFPSLKRGGKEGGKREVVGVDSTVGQKFRTSLEGVLETLAETQPWFILHVKLSDDPNSNRFDAQVVQRQLNAFCLPTLCKATSLLYSAAHKHADFLARYHQVILSQVGDYTAIQGGPKNQCEAVCRGYGHTDDLAKVGTTKIFLSEQVWWSLEASLAEIEEAERHAAMGGAESEYGAETEYGIGGVGEDVESHYESEFGGLGGIPLKKMDATDAAEQGRLLQNQLLSKKKSELSTGKKVKAGRKVWVCFTWGLTWWIPSIFLSCAGMKSADRRMAWREKVALCIIIAFLNALILFFIIGIGLIVCPTQKVLSAGQISAKNQLNGNPMVYMYGHYYSAGDKYNSHLRNGGNANQGYWENGVFGQDISQMFYKSQFWGTYCPAYKQPAGFIYFPNQNSDIRTGKWYQHGRQTPFTDHLSAMDDYLKGTVVWDTGTILNLLKANFKVITMYDRVYDVSAFYSDAYKNKNFFPQTTYIQDLFDKYSANGADSTSDWEYLRKQDPQTHKDVLACMDGLFWIGNIDHRNDLRCQVPNYILLAASAILVIVIGVKFLAALQFGGKRTPEDHDKFVICLVPCYTEGESSLAKTIESLASMEYEDKHKLLFIIADGMIIGSGNDRPTPRIVLDILGVDPSLDPESKSFESLGEGSKQHNVGKIYSGLYEMNGRVVPYVVVVKVGRPSERQRPGNRGKRDSQLILMRFLSRVHFNQPMNPLELELYHHMKNIIGVDPSFYEFIFSVDADTEPYKDSLNRLIAQMVRDAKIIGLCGETKLANERESWVSAMQVYEYYISHNLAKAFESLFGSVTCLPGCFSIYRIRTPVKNIPLLIAPGIIQDYSENQVDTLHLKNLLYLGEDRYLTTLLMKYFPHMRTTFIPDAKCKTVGPAKFAVLLSQRRRWINSTVHNLMELLTLNNLCGVCCFDMRFVVFIDLFATVVQPATLAYIVYLVYAATALGPDQFSFPLISILMIAAIYGFQVIIFMLKREWQHIGWMVVYLLCIPFSGLYIPLYAFWHFDDFSWGNTRVVIEDGQTKEVDADSEPFNPAEIPLEKWTDYEEARQKQIEANPPPRSATPSIAGGYQVPAFYAGSAYGAPAPSAYGAPVASVFGAPAVGGGSVYGAIAPNGSAYGVMPYGAIPQMAGSVYGGSAYGAPVMAAVPVRPGSVYGGSNYGQPVVYAGSVMSASTSRSQPSDEQILAQIRQILSNADLMTVTRKSVREELTRVFAVDLSSRKEFIHNCIDGVLKGEL